MTKTGYTEWIEFVEGEGPWVFMHDLASPGLLSKQYQVIHKQYKLFCFMQKLGILEYDELIEGTYQIWVKKRCRIGSTGQH